VLQIQEQELALSRQKINEKAWLEQLRLEEEVAVAKVTAIENELGISDLQGLDLPEEHIDQKVNNYLENQYEFTPDNIDIAQPFQQPHPTTQPFQQQHPAAQPFQQQQPAAQPSQPLDPTASAFHPTTRTSSPSEPGQDTMKPYIDFMACRELIANKIEKFDDQAGNYHVWKESFQNMIRHVNITPSEELSLITKHSTKNSKNWFSSCAVHILKIQQRV
jgi:hypothetical protein